MIINVYSEVVFGSAGEIYEITYMFNEMHIITQFLGLWQPRYDGEKHHRPF